MRKLIILSFISLDGIMQAPGGPEEDTSDGFKYGGWTVPYFDEFSGKIMEKQMAGRSDLLLGRKTFEIFASYWPGHPNEWPGINEVTKYVASHQQLTFSWDNSKQLDGDAVTAVKNLKKENGPDLQVHGSGNFIQTLLKNNLADELWLKIFPVTLGKGKRLFTQETLPVAFELFNYQVSPSGVIFTDYKRKGEVETGSF